MRSPSLLSSPTFGAFSVLSLLAATQLSQAAPAGLPPLPPYSSSPPSSPSLRSSPSLPSSPSFPLSPYSSPPPSPSFAPLDDGFNLDEDEDGNPFEDELDAGLGLAITIPLHKRDAYLDKRQLPVVDFAWLRENKERVRRKFGGSLNPNSPLFRSPLAGGDGGWGEDDSDEGGDDDEGSTGPATNTTIEVQVQAQSSAALPLPSGLPVALPSPPVRRGGSASGEALTDQSSLWMGPITIGGQDFEVDFDTGSSDLWVPGTACKKDGCQGHTKYARSDTAVKRSGSFAITYGDGSKTSGPVYTDAISIAGLDINNQTFSPVTVMSPSFANTQDSPGYPADGIAGMGFPQLSQTRSSPFFQSLVQQKRIPASIFSFRLTATKSELYLGGINSAHYSGQIVYTDVTQQAYWTVALGGVKVGSRSISIKGSDSVIDTGTTLVYGSYDDVQTIYKSIPGSKDMSASYGSDYQGYWLFPCSKIPSVSLSFGGTSFTIPPSAFNLGKAASGSSDCVGALVGQDPDASGLGNTFLIGDAFLTSYYTVFDVANSRVGFAPVKP